MFLACRSCIAGVNMREEEREEDEALDLEPAFAAAALDGVECEDDMAAWGSEQMLALNPKDAE